MKKSKYCLYFSILFVLSLSLFGNFSVFAQLIPSPATGLTITDNPPPLSPPPSPSPPGNEGLISGMTPGNYTLPAGWTLVVTQDFEGSIPRNQLIETTPTTTRPHSGSKGLEATYGNDQAQLRWLLLEGNVGSFTEVYISFYEYTESQARFNDEYWVAQFVKHGPGGELYQEIIADWMWVPEFNSTSAYLYVVPQSAGGGGTEGRYGGALKTVPVGAWVQWEIHYRPNTPGNSNGFFRIYKDGSLWSGNSVENANLNGSVDMSNMGVQVGGIYTKLVWMLDAPTCNAPSQCSTNFGNGSDWCTGLKNWWGQSFTNPVCPATAQSNFKRFIDDVIVLKK